MQDISIFIAFYSGVISFFAPCIIPLLPAYISYVTGVSLKELKKEGGVEKYKREIVVSSLWYVVGFSILFVILGTTAASFGGIFRQNKELLEIVGGMAIMLLACDFLGWIEISFLSSRINFSIPKWLGNLGRLRAFFLGILFAVVWTPCIGAVLGVILTLAAASQTAFTGAILLLVYSLGISIPFLLVSLIMLRFPKLLEVLKKHMGLVSKISGILLLIIGFLLFNNNVKLFGDALTYDALNGWLFKTAHKFGYSIK